MYYIHLHGNSGYIYILLPGNTDWTSFDIEYCQDRLCDIKESRSRKISVSELPLAMTCTFDFGQIRERIREVYQLNKPAGLEKEVVA